MVNVGDVFYDDRNGRYITVDGFGCNTSIVACVVEEMNDDGDYQITGRQLFTIRELKHFERR